MGETTQTAIAAGALFFATGAVLASIWNLLRERRRRRQPTHWRCSVCGYMTHISENPGARLCCGGALDGSRSFGAVRKDPTDE